MTTIKDVARRAEVSVGTVSRVLANHQAVKAKLRHRVEQAMQDLDYKPNLLARALRTNKIDIVGLVVPDITNPFFAQLAKEVETAAARQGISVLLANSLEHAELQELRIRAILDRGPLGILLVTASGHSKPQNLPNDVKFVALDRPLEGLPLISTDHEKSSALAMDHLFELGHRKICYIAGPRDTPVAQLRERGFVARAKELGKTGDKVELQVIEGVFDYASGESIARMLLSAGNRLRPSAIATASDQQAIGVIRAARDLGIKVPDELSVVGYDDITLANLVVPRLTTIRQPTHELAAAAIKFVLEPDHQSAQSHFVGKLVHRSSSTPVGTAGNSDA